jgi:ABC-2 type transport system permease protein
MKYGGNVKLLFKQGMASRAMTVMWVLTKPLAILVAITVWTSIYNYTGQGAIGGFTLDETKGYMMFTILFGAITYTNIGKILGKDIHRGNLSKSLVKPVDYGLARLSGDVGNRLYAAMFELLPGLIIAVIFFGFHQFNPLMTLFSIISICLALIINFFLSINWALMYFKTTASDTFEWIKDIIFGFFSGRYIPLNFLPAIFQAVLNYLPLQFLVYVPARIFINSYSVSGALSMLLIQVSWVFFLYAIYKVGWHYSIKHFSGVGA